MSHSCHIVVPARYASTRLPAKPLADIAGKPMIVRVLERVSLTQAADCVAAVDDERVFDAVTDAGFDAVMTRLDHPSGSDRVMEVASLLKWPDDDLVINVQGDEPLIPPDVVNALISTFEQGAPVQIVTMREPLTEPAQIADPNVVKVVCDEQGQSLYFSRAPIPFVRDDGMTASYYRHIGIYGFRVSALRRVTQLPVSQLEQLEMLEQLRWLENGEKIHVATAASALPGGVDTPADLEKVRTLFNSIDET